MRQARFAAGLALVAMLGACSGGSGSVSAPGSTGSAPTPGSSPTPTPTTAGCSLRERQDWVFAQMNEWYLFYDTLPSSLNPAPYPTVEDYLDALTATARAQHKDRYFTYLTSISDENAYYASGSSAGFGVRLAIDGSNRLFISEAFEGAPALAAGIDRGTEIVAIGTTGDNLKTVAALVASGGTDAVNEALGPSTVGTTRYLQISDSAGTRVVSVTKTEYELTPVSSRYGAKIIDDAGRKVGYVNLRTFISTADPALKSAFAMFKAQGVTDVIVDLRYNGGGLVSIAETFGNLLGANRGRSDVFTYTAYRPSKSGENSTEYFKPLSQSIAPTRIAFIGTGGTASASELVINGMFPYLKTKSALIGTNTYGKPVGQIALDKSSCDDRLRVIAFAKENAAHQGAYYDGLADIAPVTCQAADDINYPLGDPNEASTKAALGFLDGRSCSAIGSSGGITTQSVSARSGRELLTPSRPTTAEREVPGLR